MFVIFPQPLYVADMVDPQNVRSISGGSEEGLFEDANPTFEQNLVCRYLRLEGYLV